MARGWESKSVESQQSGDAEGSGAARPAEEREMQRRRSGLELSRARVLSQLEVTEAPVRREALESALAFLEAELAKLGKPG